jgi:hypothetical protein
MGRATIKLEISMNKTPSKIAGTKNNVEIVRLESGQYWPRKLTNTPDGVIGGFQQVATYRFGGPTGGALGTEGRLVGPYHCGELFTELSPWVYRR